MKGHGYVINDQQGKYITGRAAFLSTKEGWMYLSFTGRTTGFTYFKNREKAEIEKTELDKLCKQYKFNKGFSIGYIDIKSVPIGRLVIEDILASCDCKMVNNI